MHRTLAPFDNIGKIQLKTDHMVTAISEVLEAKWWDGRGRATGAWRRGWGGAGALGDDPRGAADLGNRTWSRLKNHAGSFGGGNSDGLVTSEPAPNHPLVQHPAGWKKSAAHTG